MSGLGTFDLDVFTTKVEDLERNLGELKALEMVLESWYRWVSDQNGLENVGAEWYWSVPSEKHPFQWIFITNMFPDQQSAWSDVVDDCWRQGETWSAGVAARFTELVQRWAEADAGVLAEQARSLDSRVVTDLQRVFTADDWSSNADRGTSLSEALQQWKGRAKTSFSIFYNNVDSKVNYWADVASRVAGSWAAHAVVLDGGQKAMMEIVTKAVEHPDAQLANWAAAHQSWPYGTVDSAFTVAQVVDVVALAAGAASLIPPLAPAAGPIRTVATLTGTVLDKAGDGGSKKNVELKAEKAFDIYQETYDALNLEAVVATTSAMINLRSARTDASSDPLETSTGDLVRDSEEMGDEFFAPRLPGIDDPQPGDWRYEG